MRRHRLRQSDGRIVVSVEIDHADCVIKLIADRLLDPSEEDDRAAIASTHACFEFACPVG